MTTAATESPAKVCSQCDSPATYFGRRNRLCVVHYRLRQMRYDSQASGKEIPAETILHRLAEQTIAAGMKCPVCSASMNWRKADGIRTVISLQHDRDGGFRFVCLSCNVKHQFHPGDLFYEAPDGHRWCKRCSEFKPLTEFYVHRYAKRNVAYPRTICKRCELRQKFVERRLGK